MSVTPTLKATREAIIRLHSEELGRKRPNEKWLRALEAAARTTKKLENGSG